ncbi:23S rRNA (guanosine-2'-O-)-methyltransferase RlmB [Symmachiella dynata]|uniref:23S rRNA (guanosine(2251)-2'-O)-methyltransferase RlmB n=1 Tax=Symmachiella dynata TaxID=2527995 RepID=UPI0011881FC2|nr:23S rRNA (guanosine(2251)-2'-O)-methyltransferase RlmB [Symmachiella dynata]QDT47196.1 23S rRNA (guanosine-2'-O-)-methyltransferase RlmB [Symmachiella dynata]
MAAAKKRRDALLGNHQRCWLWGRHLVRQTLEANRWPIHEIRLADRLGEEELSRLQSLADRHHVPVLVETATRLTQLAKTKDHQGYLAKMGIFPYTPAEDLLQSPVQNPLYLILDAMQDAYNFGAVIRSAEVFGASAIVVGKHRQATVNSLVARSSVGAVNRVPIVQSADVVTMIQLLQTQGILVYGASEKAVEPIFKHDLSGPIGLVIGNEGTGISSEVQAVCDGFVRIPLQGEIGSLNAAVAAGIVLYEATRQR